MGESDAQFPYLMNDEYEVWATKMEHWITNNDINIWKVIQNGNSAKRCGRDHDGNLFHLPPVTAAEHIAVQRESKARTTLLQSIPAEHVSEFSYMDDAGEIWKAIKARYGRKAESKKMRKEACSIGDAEEFALMGTLSKVQNTVFVEKNCIFGCVNNFRDSYTEIKKECEVLKAKYNECFLKNESLKEGLKTLERQKRWFQKNEIAYEEKIKVLERDLTDTTNELKYCEKEKAKLESENQELKVKYDNEVSGRIKWQEGATNLGKLIDSSQSVRSRRALGYDKYIDPEELTYDDISSVFDPEPEPLLQFQKPVKYVKEGGMNAVPGPIRGEFMPSSTKTSDFDGSHHLFGKKSNDLPNSDSSDKYSNVNVPTPIAVSVKRSESISTKSTSFTPNSSVSTSKSKVEVESKVKTHKQEPIVVQDLPSNKSDNNIYNSRTSCNKNGCFNKKAGKVKKKTCFVCGSKSHLIKDCDFHEKRMGMSTDQKRPRPVWTNVASIPPFVPKATHVKTSKHNPADKSAHWKRHVARPFYIPTSTYFQNGFWPSYYDPMYMGWGARWDTNVKPSTGCSWKTKSKGSFWVPKNNSPCQVH